ncbi:MAG: gamma carbonic anhydrase family protein [Lentisphaeria bacterium]|nr:gamma carbonic anhydrase family protein [Candidatus Neomarinimicrobiota bacterium]MCF7841620.1 gamma carbonic anhydrase family protein [Lentisphaeria bacterium]
MIIQSYQAKTPKIHPSAWIAENAVIIGDVEIGPQVNIWYNVVIRGDLNRIVIGAETNVQDGTIIHVESDNGPCLIGGRVTIGHAAIVHGCVVGDNALIGMGATVLSWAKLGEGSLIAANALIKERVGIPARTLWAGIPARQHGEVSDEMFARMQEGCDHYLQLADEYRRLIK